MSYVCCSCLKGIKEKDWKIIFKGNRYHLECFRNKNSSTAVLCCVCGWYVTDNDVYEIKLPHISLKHFCSIKHMNEWLKSYRLKQLEKNVEITI